MLRVMLIRLSEMITPCDLKPSSRNTLNCLDLQTMATENLETKQKEEDNAIVQDLLRTFYEGYIRKRLSGLPAFDKVTEPLILLLSVNASLTVAEGLMEAWGKTVVETGALDRQDFLSSLLAPLAFYNCEGGSERFLDVDGYREEAILKDMRGTLAEIGTRVRSLAPHIHWLYHDWDNREDKCPECDEAWTDETDPRREVDRKLLCPQCGLAPPPGTVTFFWSDTCKTA